MEAFLTYKSNWWGYVFKRVLIAVIAFFIFSLLIFFTLHLESDWLASYRPLLWTRWPFNEISHQLGWDAPLVVQYFHWIGDFFTGDWGYPLRVFMDNFQ